MTWLDYLTEPSKITEWQKILLSKLIDTDMLDEPINTIAKVLYKSGERSMVATNNSEFKQTLGSVYSCNKDGQILYTVPKSVVWYIDNNRVSRETFEEVIKRLELMIYSKTKRRCVWKTLSGSDGATVWKIEEPVCFENDSYKRYHDDYYGLGELQAKIRGKRAECCVCDDHIYMGDSVYAQLNEILNSIEKENEDMPKIVNYKYNEEKGLTEITWDDKTITRVVAGDDTEKSAYVGFVSACAKKLFGNKSTYLNQFDKWTVKIPERERLAAEKKAAEDKEREEAKARKAAKKAERRAKREVELLARGFAENYNNNSVYEKAKKLAMKKYGVPADYFDDNCDCHCNCKEFDVMDEDENNISD